MKIAETDYYQYLNNIEVTYVGDGGLLWTVSYYLDNGKTSMYCYHNDMLTFTTSVQGDRQYFIEGLGITE